MADRMGRIQIFQETMTQCETDPELRACVRQSKEKQSIIWEEDALSPVTARYDRPAHLTLSFKRTFEAARPYANQGKKVCALNFASSMTPGGGVTKGAGAQEESLCRISTLYPALTCQETAGAFYERHWQKLKRGELTRKNWDDCIYTPGVKVIREDTFDCDFLNKKDWYDVDVITCAAPDLRYDAYGNTYQPLPEELTAVFERRWRRILSVAALHGAEALILGAFGCDAFCNPPEVAAQAFAHVCGDYLPCFETIEFAVFADSPLSPNYLAFSHIPGISV